MAFGGVVQSNSGTSTSGTTAPTLGSATGAGNLIALSYAADDYNGSPNSGWTQSTGGEQQFFHGGYLWWLIATAGMTIPSYTIATAVRSAWVLVEYEGPFDPSPLDVANGTGVNSSASSIATPSITPSTGSRLLVAGVQFQHSSTDQTAISFNNSFTLSLGVLFNGGGNPRLAVGQSRRLVTGDGSTSFTTTGSGGASLSRSGIINSFKASTATGIPNKLVMPKQGLVRAAYW